MVKRISNSSLSRRELLRLIPILGGATALASFLQGCAMTDIDTEAPLSPTAASSMPASVQATVPAAATSTPEISQPTVTSVVPTAAPSATPVEIVEDGKARVAFVKTNDRAEGVRKAIDLLGINPVAGKRVFLKPNFNSSDPPPGSTHPDVLLALVTALNAMGAQHITVGDRSGMGDTRQVMDQLGVFRMAEENGFDAVVFDELTADDWVLIEPPDSHWQQGFALPRPALEADALVQTCCLKTHQYGGHFTLSLKNSVGLVAKRHPQVDHDFMQELHASPHQRRMIAEINAAYTPALIVMDGVEAFISGGPHAGEQVTPAVVLAGADRIALDAVGIALLRYYGCKTEAGIGKIFEQEQIARAVELGLGIDSPQKIEFLTGDPDSAAYSEQIKQVLSAG